MRWSSVIVAEIMLSVSLCVQFPAPVLATNEAATASTEIMRLQSAYDNGLKKLESDQAKAVANLHGQYTNALVVLERKAQEDGKLEQVVFIRRERERFDEEKTVGDNNLSSDIPELKNQQKNYMKFLKEMPLRKARDVVALAQQFDKALATLEQNLTKTGDIAGALDVRNVRGSLNDRSEVAEANFAIAEADSNKPKTPEQAPPPPPVKIVKSAQPSNKVDKASSPAGAKKYTVKTANYVKQRYMKLYEAIYDNDKQGMKDIVDPSYLKKEGEGAVNKQLDFIFAWVSLMKTSGIPKRGPAFKVDAKVKVEDKEEAATLIPKLWFYGRWNDQSTTYWVQVDGDWYIDLYTDIKKGGNSRNFNVPGWSTSRSR